MVYGNSHIEHNLGFNKLVTAAKHKSKVTAAIKSGNNKPLFGSVRVPANIVNNTVNNSGPSKSSGLNSIAGAGAAVNSGSNSARNSGANKVSAANLASINSAKLNGVDALANRNISGSLYEDVANKNNAIAIAMNRENNAFNAAQAAAQRNYETMMANTAHQREVQDLKAAGLNPILSAGGTGAVTPSGASAGASNFTGTDNSIVSALAGLASASISANATMSAAATNAAATRDAASMTAGAAVAAAAQNAQANMYASDNAKQASMYGSFVGAGTGRYTADKQMDLGILKMLK